MAKCLKNAGFKQRNKENIDNININLTFNIPKEWSLKPGPVFLGRKIENSQINLSKSHQNNINQQQFPIVIEENKAVFNRKPQKMVIQEKSNRPKTEGKRDKVSKAVGNKEKTVNFNEIIAKIKEINPFLKRIFEMNNAEIPTALLPRKRKGKKASKALKVKKIEDNCKKIGENPKKIEENCKKIEDRPRKIEDRPRKIEEKPIKISEPLDEKVKKIDRLIMENLRRRRRERELQAARESAERQQKMRKIALLNEKNKKIREFNKTAFLSKLSSGKTIRFVSNFQDLNAEKGPKTCRPTHRKRVLTAEELSSLREFMKKRRLQRQGSLERKVKTERLSQAKREESRVLKGKSALKIERIDAGLVYRTAAVFIQKFWRGFQARKLYCQMRLETRRQRNWREYYSLSKGIEEKSPRNSEETINKSPSEDEALINECLKESLIELSASSYSHSSSAKRNSQEFVTRYHFEDQNQMKQPHKTLSLSLDSEENSSLFAEKKLANQKTYVFDCGKGKPGVAKTSGKTNENLRKKWESLKPRKMLGSLDFHTIMEAVEIRERMRKIRPELKAFDGKTVIRGFKSIVRTINQAKIESSLLVPGLKPRCLSEGDGFLSPVDLGKIEELNSINTISSASLKPEITDNIEKHFDFDPKSAKYFAENEIDYFDSPKQIFSQITNPENQIPNIEVSQNPILTPNEITPQPLELPKPQEETIELNQLTSSPNPNWTSSQPIKVQVETKKILNFKNYEFTDNNKGEGPQATQSLPTSPKQTGLEGSSPKLCNSIKNRSPCISENSRPVPNSPARNPCLREPIEPRLAEFSESPKNFMVSPSSEGFSNLKPYPPENLLESPLAFLRADHENKPSGLVIKTPKELSRPVLVSSPLTASHTIPFSPYSQKTNQKAQEEKEALIVESVLELLLDESIKLPMVSKAFSVRSAKGSPTSSKSPPKEYALESSQSPKESKMTEISTVAVAAATSTLTRQKFNDMFLEFMIQFKSVILYESPGLMSLLTGNLNQPLGDSEAEKLRRARENAFKFTAMISENAILPYLDRRTPMKPVIPNDQYSRVLDSISLDYGEFGKGYFRAVFDSLNEILNIERPFGAKGQPYRWEKGLVGPAKSLKQEEVEEILERSLEKIEKFPSFLCGIFLQRDAFLASNRRNGSFEDFVARTREEKMKRMIMGEYKEGCEDWQDFREEELELKLEISELVYQEVVDELVVELSKMVRKRA